MMIYLGTPNLETERLLLRKFSLEDAKDMYEYASDPEVAKYVTWNSHQTINDSLGFIQLTLDRYEKDEAGDWGIVLKGNNKFIGSCGFVWVDKKNLCGHIGYTLSRKYWNMGIMSEAVKRLMEFGFNKMNLYRIEAFHELPNEASGRVMQKVGMKYEGILRGRMFSKEHFWDVKQYAMTKEDWLSNVKEEVTICRACTDGDEEMVDALIKYYEQECNEDGRLQRDKAHSMEFLTTVRYFEKLFPKDAKVLDACAGTGVYSFYLAEKGYKVTAGDIVPYNVSLIEKKQSEIKLLDNIYTGDVLDLSIFEEGSFDVVLCMGALYHLQDKAKRVKAIRECLRVLKKDGILATAYINRYAAILYNCGEKLVNIDELLEYSKTGIKNSFYGSTPREIDEMMADAGIETICNIGTDGIGYTIYSKINNSDDKVFEKWLDYHYATCEDENILGYSLHGMSFGRKR